MADHLESATREIVRLNKIARRFEDEAARLTKERDDLREALRRCPQYIILAIIDARSSGKMKPETIEIAERDLDAVDKALANTEKETGP